MEKFIGITVVILMAILGPPVVCFLPLWAIWNWVGVEVFNLSPISLFQSFGIMLMFSCILFPASGWGNTKI